MGRGEWRNKGKGGKIEQISRRGDEERKEGRPVGIKAEAETLIIGKVRLKTAAGLFQSPLTLKASQPPLTPATMANNPE